MATSLLAGDYNGNGIVDAADFVVWRNSLGQSGSSLAADGDGNGTIQLADYNFWRDHFGDTYANGSVTAVPEPTNLTLVATLLIGSALLTRRRRGLRGEAPSSHPPIGHGSGTIHCGAILCASAIAALLTLTNFVSADVTVDRLYLFGEHPSEPATAGNIVGAGGLGTLDSVSLSGSPTAIDAQNLAPGGGGPRYAAVGPSGLESTWGNQWTIRRSV